MLDLSSEAHRASLMLLIGWIAVLRLLRRTTWTIALASFPGTVLHELAHFLVGFFLGARPVSFQLIPRRGPHGWMLGSVGFVRLNLVNAAPVALAPLLLLPAAVWLETAVMAPAFAQGHLTFWIASGYLGACALWAGWPSWVDIRLGALSALLWAGMWAAWQVLLLEPGARADLLRLIAHLARLLIRLLGRLLAT